MSDGTSTSFEVETIDQVNDGLIVWAVVEECIDTLEIAQAAAREHAQRTRFKRARVVQVVRTTVDYMKGDADG